MSDLLYALLSVGIPFVIMIVFFLIWKKQEKVLRKVIGFTAVNIILAGGFIIFAAGALIYNADPNYDWCRKAAILTAAAFCIWYACWCSQYKMDNEEGIARKL